LVREILSKNIIPKCGGFAMIKNRTKYKYNAMKCERRTAVAITDVLNRRREMRRVRWNKTTD
jgi:hypothetical protein